MQKPFGLSLPLWTTLPPPTKTSLSFFHPFLSPVSMNPLFASIICTCLSVDALIPSPFREKKLFFARKIRRKKEQGKSMVPHKFYLAALISQVIILLKTCYHIWQVSSSIVIFLSSHPLPMQERIAQPVSIPSAALPAFLRQFYSQSSYQSANF